MNKENTESYYKRNKEKILKNLKEKKKSQEQIERIKLYNKDYYIKNKKNKTLQIYNNSIVNSKPELFITKYKIILQKGPHYIEF